MTLESLLSVNSSFVTLHLHRWPDGGCPIHYYVIEYKEESQPTWRIVSNNIRSVIFNVLRIIHRRRCIWHFFTEINGFV